MKQNNNENIQIYNSSKLAYILKQCDISKLKLTSVGNSIASGYAIRSITKPLLHRSNVLEQILTQNGIILEKRHFARVMSNNDDQMLEWLINNTSESYIHKLNHVDYGESKINVHPMGIEEKMDEYYPLEIEKDLGLQDVVLSNEQGEANIIIYNGCTGSFIQSFTRGGKTNHKINLTYGVKKDITSLESFIKFINIKNRKQSTNTQIYLCGVPDYFGIGITKIISNKMKRLALKYPNIVYVEPVKSKAIYPNTTSRVPVNPIMPFFDNHYNVDEYSQLMEHIIEGLNENYLITKAMINFDRKLINLNNFLEVENQGLIDSALFIFKQLEEILLEEINKLPSKKIKQTFIKKAYAYFKEMAPFDFYYVSKIDNNTDIVKSFIKKFAI